MPVILRCGSIANKPSVGSMNEGASSSRNSPSHNVVVDTTRCTCTLEPNRVAEGAADDS